MANHISLIVFAALVGFSSACASTIRGSRVEKITQLGAVTIKVDRVGQSAFHVHVEQQAACFAREIYFERHVNTVCDRQPQGSGCIISETHLDGPSGSCNKPLANTPVVLNEWNGHTEELQTDSKGDVSGVITGEFLLPENPQHALATIRVGEQTVPLDLGSKPYADSIIRRRAFDELERFRARFGDQAVPGQMKAEQEKIAIADAKQRDLAEKVRALEAMSTSDRARVDLAKAMGPRGRCALCVEDVIQILTADAVAVRDEGDSRLAKEIDGRVKEIVTARKRWEADKSVPDQAKLVWSFNQDVRVGALSSEFSPRVRAKYGSGFKLQPRAKVDQFATPVFVSITPDSVEVDLTFRPGTGPMDGGRAMESRGGAVALFAKHACPLAYSGYLQYAIDAFLRLRDGSSADSDFIDLLRTVKSTSIFVWTEEGDALAFQWSGAPTGTRGGPLLSVYFNGQRYVVDGGYDYWVRGKTEDLQGRMTGLGAMQKVLASLGVRE